MKQRVKNWLAGFCGQDALSAAVSLTGGLALLLGMYLWVSRPDLRAPRLVLQVFGLLCLLVYCRRALSRNKQKRARENQTYLQQRPILLWRLRCAWQWLFDDPRLPPPPPPGDS